MTIRSDLQLYGLILLLLVIGMAMTVYRHTEYDIPFLPGEKITIWSVEAKIEFEAMGGPARVSFTTADSQRGFERLGERTASPGYGFSFVEEDNHRRAQWSVREARGKQTLYYQADLLEIDREDDSGTALPPTLRDHQHPEPEASIARALLHAARSRSADNYTLAQELVKELNQQEEATQLLTQSASRIQWLIEILQNAKIPVRKVNTLYLLDQRRSQGLVPYLQVFDQNGYRLVNPESGAIGRTRNQILWGEEESTLIEVTGGRKTRVGFSMVKREVPHKLLSHSDKTDNRLLSLSIHDLPLEEQALFKGVLLMPIGVLLVVFMRIFVGLRTSGTFMPVLIALAFIQISLLPGIAGLLLIVSLGLLLRAYLSRHNLLLVARISSVIMIVIFIIAILTLLSYRFGFSNVLKTTFFPMVILAWTIERLSILWEEEGPREVLMQGGGSVFVAVIAYALMNNAVIKHLTFNFIGLQFVFMALILLGGTYTGYRLTELRRFIPLGKPR